MIPPQWSVHSLAYSHQGEEEMMMTMQVVAVLSLAVHLQAHQEEYQKWRPPRRIPPRTMSKILKIYARHWRRKKKRSMTLIVLHAMYVNCLVTRLYEWMTSCYVGCSLADARWWDKEHKICTCECWYMYKCILTRERSTRCIMFDKRTIHKWFCMMYFVAQTTV